MATEHPPSLEGLDYAFLRWLPVVPEDQKNYQRFYLSFFEHCEHVVDLGCGEGNFVELLREQGIDAMGVDFDRQCCEAAWQRNIPVIHQNALDYLAQAPSESLDGIFSAHLVEHLPYETVIELLQGAYRVLKPGGVIVLTTPNVRGLFSHLEMFYLHFGHVTFYHPRLLCFFLTFAGFSQPEYGENPTQPHPLFQDLLDQLANQPDLTPEPADMPSIQPIQPIRYDPQLPRSRHPLRRLIWHAKMFMVRLIVQPYLDHFMTEINQRMDVINHELQKLDHYVQISQNINHHITMQRRQFTELLQRLDHSFEAYAVAYKSPPQSE